MDRHSKGVIEILLLAVVVVIGIVGIGYSLIKNGQLNRVNLISQPNNYVDGEHDNNLTDVSKWKTYKNTEIGYEFKYPDGSNLEDFTNFFNEGSGTKSYKSVIDIWTPGYDEYYTGGDWGRMVNVSGMLIRVLVTNTVHKSLEDVANQIDRIDKTSYEEVMFNGRKYLFEENRSAHTIAKSKSQINPLKYEIFVMGAGEDNPDLYKKMFELFLQNFEIYSTENNILPN